MMKSLQKCLFVCLLLISSNINAQFFECYILKPPEKYLEGVKKIAIMDFNITTDGYNISGDKGQVLNDYMTSYLLDEYRGIYNIDKKEGKTYIKGATTNVFTIIERNRLSQVLNEQKMNQSGIVNDNQAVEVGKILGIDVMIIGTISFEAKDEESTNRYKDGSVSYCTKRIVSTEARMKIISVKTGQIIGTKEVAQTYSSKKCNKERSGLTSVSKLIDFCLKDIAYMLVDYYSPRYKLQKYKFVKIKNKEFKEQTNKAVKFIKSGDIDNAYTIYNEIYKADPYSAIAAHNLACLYDIVGNYAKAVEYWGIAAELDAKSYQKSLKHAEEELAVKGIYADMGILIEKYEFIQDNNALADKVKTIGKKSDRYDVKAKPENEAETVAKVPGNTEFVVLEKSGNWILIKLLGGKQGYINKSDVD